MANYIINQCLTNNQYVISADTLTPGITIEFGIGEDLFCGTVVEETMDPITPGYYYNFELYSDCCECLVNDGRESLNFSFIRCGTDEEINIEATNFCTEFGLPTIGITYEIQYDSEKPFCATFEGLSLTGVTDYSFSSGPFLLCEDCGEEPPRSANTETFICVPDCEFTESTPVSPPHPVWTDGYGTAVTQLNMVVLGGPNGLNA
jgi:hypothetical protein